MFYQSETIIETLETFISSLRSGTIKCIKICAQRGIFESVSSDGFYKTFKPSNEFQIKIDFVNVSNEDDDDAIIIAERGW